MREREKRRPSRSPGGRGTGADIRRSPRRAIHRRSSTGPEPRGAASRTRSAPEQTFFGLSTARALILAGVLCALASTLAVPLRTYLGQSAEAARLAAEHSHLEVDLARLRQKRVQQHDPAYLRAEARARLRLVEPGETPYIVQLPDDYHASLPLAQAPAKPGGPWYSQLWHVVSTPPSAGASDAGLPADSGATPTTQPSQPPGQVN